MPAVKPNHRYNRIDEKDMKVLLKTIKKPKFQTRHIRTPDNDLLFAEGVVIHGFEWNFFIEIAEKNDNRKETLRPVNPCAAMFVWCD